MAQALSDLVESWKDALTTANQLVFNGTDDSILYLGNLMVDGHFIGESGEEARTTADEIKRLIFATLIPRLWRLRNRHPVFIDTGKPCEAKGVGTKDYVQAKDVEKVKVCLDNKQYQLLTTHQDVDCVGSTEGNYNTCGAWWMKAPDGLDKILTANNIWRISKDDLAIR